MEIKILGDIEAIQANPGVYTDITSPTHLVHEVLDNAMDEVLNGLGKGVWLELHDNVVTVRDTGHGFPVGTAELPDGRRIDVVEAICTKLFSGAKFDSSFYRIRIGRHGMGLVVVNALSKWLEITSWRHGKLRTWRFECSKLVDYKEIKCSKPDWISVVKFEPDPQYFEEPHINESELLSRLVLLKAYLPDTEVRYNDAKVENVTLEQYVRNLFKIDNQHPLYKVEKKDVTVYLTYGDKSIQRGAVNLRECGGKHITGFIRLWNKVIHSVYNTDIDASTGLQVYVFLLREDVQFDAQAKYRLNTNVKDQLEKLEKQLKDVAKSDFIHKVIEQLKRKKASRGIKVAKAKVSPDSPLRDCVKNPGDVLYILEGKSAEGTLKQIRDHKTEALFPLKGKILNVVGTSFEKVLQNKEVFFLLEALGYDPKRHELKPRYNQVKILCDADADGFHIICLVLMLIWKYTPQYIYDGKCFIILPPLYGAIKGKQFVPLYRLSDTQYYKQKGYNIIRFKGIGEMSPKQLEYVIRHGMQYKVQPPPDDAVKFVETVLTDVGLKRKLCNNEQLSIDMLRQRANSTDI